MGLIDGAISMIGGQEKIFGRREYVKTNLIAYLINNPEKFKLTAWIDGQTVFIQIAKKEKEE